MNVARAVCFSTCQRLIVLHDYEISIHPVSYYRVCVLTAVHLNEEFNKINDSVVWISETVNARLEIIYGLVLLR